MRSISLDRTKLRPGDFMLVIITMGLVIFGVVMVFSSSYYYALSHDGSAYSYLIRDGAWAAFGTVAMFFMALIDYRKLKKLAVPLLVISILMLVMVLIPGVGVTRNNATRWLGVGGFTIMPGEIAKVAAILFVAAFLAANPSRIKSLTKGILPMFALAALFGFLIMRQPNLSTAITVVAIIVVMMLVAGMSWGWIGALAGLFVAGVMALLTVGKGSYWYTRMTSFADPFKDFLGDGYQAAQSLMALGSGGLFGVGLGKSIQKTLYLPEPQNDFILAIIGEELGFVGVAILLIVYMLLIWRGVHIALNAPDQFGMLLAAGITAMIGIQVVLNVAVVTSSMPPTGITLPFVSYGGNALLLFMGSMGVMLNISRHSAERTKPLSVEDDIPEREV